MRRNRGIRCEEALERLWSFIDGELEPASAEEVRGHIEVCRLCYPQYDFQRAYFRLMRRLAEQEEPAALRDRVFASLLLEAGRSETA